MGGYTGSLGQRNPLKWVGFSSGSFHFMSVSDGLYMLEKINESDQNEQTGVFCNHRKTSATPGMLFVKWLQSGMLLVDRRNDRKTLFKEKVF